jgi:hypothetical protein
MKIAFVVFNGLTTLDFIGIYDPIALVVGLFQVGFSMRPINMMRAMDEICRELVGTIPPPQPVE